MSISAWAPASAIIKSETWIVSFPLWTRKRRWSLCGGRRLRSGFLDCVAVVCVGGGDCNGAKAHLSGVWFEDWPVPDPMTTVEATRDVHISALPMAAGGWPPSGDGKDANYPVPPCFCAR